MKVEEKNKAIILRKEGKSVREITEILGVSKGSVSIWVRDIKLTEEQELNLLERNNKNPGRFNGARINKEKFLEIRKKYQGEGCEEAKKRDWLFVAGCMLYWGEGSKTKNSVILVNSDPYLLKIFINFLYKCFNIKKEEINISINCYLDSGLTISEIEKYWIDKLGLNQEKLRKALINHRPNSSIHQGKGRKLSYGVCRVVVYRTDIVQKILGAIQEIGNFSKPDWLG